MTELETLSPEDNYESARRKAIKWVKELHDNHMYEASSEFIDFFNLTEEDLK